ncbi:50S ribosomal protein L6 [Acidiferrobacter sp.]|uniref:50S ribosomal protein L6 n=1 Tax=Acidiferrobacter sp. TaxID=1872107 RepID=UPI00262EC859|nr:50S ribosomal protein L6 [Acidiferrobacter sp.]
MSRVAKNPVSLPSGVALSRNGADITIKGPKGELAHRIHELVGVEQDGNVLRVTAADDSTLANALSGTTRALMQNMVMGVTKGFERRLSIVGVGYRAAVQGRKLNLTLGFSHPVVYDIPAGITIETPSQTEIVIKGADKQRVGQVAAEVRNYRPPEPYKGKGVRYSDEVVVKKEAKKK